jgi:hypothetical protein
VNNESSDRKQDHHNEQLVAMPQSSMLKPVLAEDADDCRCHCEEKKQANDPHVELLIAEDIAQLVSRIPMKLMTAANPVTTNPSATLTLSKSTGLGRGGDNVVSTALA